MNWTRFAWFTVTATISLLVWQMSTSAQQAPKGNIGAAPPGRFEFEVIESFDAKYEGDTPGHTGRGGNLIGRPNVALGDLVYRDQTQIGTVTGIEWDRPRNALRIEFDPEAEVRIAVGDVVWVDLTGKKARANDEKK